MKKVFLMGRSEAGKTSLTQALKGEELHYHKTQYTNSNEDTIDSPGEYAESKHFSVGLACFSFEADVVAIVQAADEPFNLFSDGSRCFLLRPLIGIITKVDSPYANLPMVRQWMQNMGCEHIFDVYYHVLCFISENFSFFSFFYQVADIFHLHLVASSQSVFM